jgi:hypothetical protein
MTLTGGLTTGSGGAISVANDISESTLEIVNCTISENQAGNQGGGISFFSAGNLIVTDSEISNNSVGASGSGGGIHADLLGSLNLDNSVEIRNTAITGNTVGTLASGGNAGHAAFFIRQGDDDGSVGIYDTLIQNNQALGQEANFAGGHIDSDGALMIERSTIANHVPACALAV